MQREIIKFTQSVMLGTAFALLLPLWAFAQTPEDVSRQALDLAGQDKFDQALTLLESQSPDIRDSYDAKFAQARILAWSGEHQASEAIYNELLTTYPGNVDIQNGLANLNYYRGELDEAEKLFKGVLLEDPQYEDAQRGLKRVIAARIANRRSKRGWRIDVNSGVNSFDNGQQDWNHQSVRVEYSPNELGFYGDVTRYERFGLTDVQIMAGLRSNSESAFDWNIGVGFTPDADFRSEISGQTRIGYKSEIGEGTVLHSSIGYQLDDYEFTGTIHQVSPQLMVYLNNGMIVTGRLIHVMQSDADNQTGFFVSGASPIVDRLGARLGYANAPETVGGVVIDTETIFGGLSFQISDLIELHGIYSRDDRENTFISDGFNFGITQKY